MSGPKRLVLVSLLGLAALFAFGFRHQPATLAFATLPPLLLAGALALKMKSAAFWASVLALFWFSYGVMEAWTLRGGAQGYAWGIVLLSLMVIFAGSWDGLIARFGRR